MLLQNPPKLADFRFTASIDYLTLTGVTRCELPALQGKPKWPRQAPGRLTLQEASPDDVHALAGVFPSANLYELEVCVDVRTAQPLCADQQDAALKAFKAEFVAKRLKPNFRAGPHIGFRGAYDPRLNKTLPYNCRVPSAEQQLLNGHRNDSAQVKCYFKRTDCRQNLDVARTWTVPNTASASRSVWVWSGWTTMACEPSPTCRAFGFASNSARTSPT